MSLNINGERLLAEALADAMEQDLEQVPKKEQLEKQHRFSRKFVRRIKRIEEGKEPVRDFARLGNAAKRYGGLAAAFVCIVGLAAFLGVAGKLSMGTSKSDNMAPADDSAWEESSESAGEPNDGLSDPSAEEPTDAPADAPADDAGDAPADDSPQDGSFDLPADDAKDAPADADESVDMAGEPAAPDWQEQLLAESEKADELISWHLAEVYDGMSFVLESERMNVSAEPDDLPLQTVSVSMICEVYYKEGTDGWVRVYRGDRSMSRCEPDAVWSDEYSMQQLNMTRAGTYRVVRQVNQYRQVLEVSLEQLNMPEFEEEG